MTGGVGFVMLVHGSLDRGAEVARHWAASGCPVVVHVDRRVGEEAYRRFAERLAGLDNLRFAPRHRCEWGTWSIVAATQAAAARMLAEFPGVGHVFLASGSCLPLRPVPELVAYLAAQPHTDFIESVTTPDVAWAAGGLEGERFLYRFPFAWRRRRRLFDAAVAIQRRLGLTRRMPDGLVPHLGSQCGASRGRRSTRS
jgi:NAD(P)-dependent dehydrogenase (short-subunit alcohol dehydrogenase family)